jgi:hypothetical protein
MNKLIRAFSIKMVVSGRGLLAHACNPRYSGGRDQEDCGLNPAGTNSLRDPLEKTHHKKGASRVAQVCLANMRP